MLPPIPRPVFPTSAGTPTMRPPAPAAPVRFADGSVFGSSPLMREGFAPVVPPVARPVTPPVAPVSVPPVSQPFTP
ncbi:MAG: hypothetical protein FWF75_04285, partial [Propionibacteriaceae bacterium]|nr:hypothetical protein [Propionibacteriaceae bacterium]